MPIEDVFGTSDQALNYALRLETIAGWREDQGMSSLYLREEINQQLAFAAFLEAQEAQAMQVQQPQADASDNPL